MRNPRISVDGKFDLDIDIQVDRFEKKFFEISEDSISNLINEYPFLFSNEFDVSNWIDIAKDHDKWRKLIF